MAVRIRKNGKILCAAMNPEEEGDLYIDDGLHYELCRAGVLITEEHEDHVKSGGEWWWITQLPSGRKLDIITGEFRSHHE